MLRNNQSTQAFLPIFNRYQERNQTLNFIGVASNEKILKFAKFAV